MGIFDKLFGKKETPQETKKDCCSNKEVEEKKTIMNITKDSIVKSICGIKSNITLSKLCDYFGIEDIEDVIESLISDQYSEWDGEYIINCDENGENISYCDILKDEGMTTVILEKIFGEEYMKMVTTHLYYYEYDDKPTSPTYLEHEIEDKSGVFLSKVTKNHHEMEIINIGNDNFLSDDEISEWNGYCENSEVEWVKNYGFHFMKKSEFNENKWWLGWTTQD